MKKYSEEVYIEALKYMPFTIILIGMFKGMKGKTLHKHRKCGHIREVRPDSLLQGTGCPICRKIKKTTYQYINELKSKYNDIVLMEEYKGPKRKILHKHKVCGYKWLVAPDKALRGRGCPRCASYGFDKTKPAILYYLSVKNGTAFKIGITNRTVHERYSNEELQDITLLKEWYFDVGQEAYALEQRILIGFKHKKYTGEFLLKSGNTELFKEDILKGYDMDRLIELNNFWEELR